MRAGSIALRMGNGTQTEGLYWLLSDHLGSTAITVNSAGNPYGEVRYKAWGETRFTSGSNPTTFCFTGQRQEEQLGLYFYNARWCDPALGRFIQADTVVPGPGNSQAWDRYAYTLNNPLRYVDPSGHDPWWCSDSDSGCHAAYIKWTTDLTRTKWRKQQERDESAQRLLPGPPYRVTTTPTYPTLPTRAPICLVTPSTLGSNYQTGTYLYRVIVIGGEKKLQIYTLEGGEMTTLWIVDYQATYEAEVYENGMYLTVTENVSGFSNNNPQANGDFSSVLEVTTDAYKGYYDLGTLSYGTKTSGPFWIKQGNMDTWVKVIIAIFGEGSSGSKYYWFSQ